MKIVMIKAEMQAEICLTFSVNSVFRQHNASHCLVSKKTEINKNLNNYWIDRHVNIIDCLQWQFQCHG